MTDAFLLSAARTPIGKYLGALAEVPAPQLGAVALAEALPRRGETRSGKTKSLMGCVIRQAWVKAPHAKRPSRPASPIPSPPSPLTKHAAPA